MPGRLIGRTVASGAIGRGSSPRRAATHNAPWCNGITAAFGAANQGSNPCGATFSNQKMVTLWTTQKSLLKSLTTFIR